MRNVSRTDALKNYALIFGPVLVIAAIIYSSFVLSIAVDFLTAGLLTYAVSLAAIAPILWVSGRTIPRGIRRIEDQAMQDPRQDNRVLNNIQGNNVLLTVFHLKLIFTYAFLISFGLLVLALKILSQSGNLLEALGLFQSYLYDIVFVMGAIALLVLPLWLLRRVQRQAVRGAESALYSNQYRLGFPEIEATVSRRGTVEKVWGRVLSISNQLVIAKAGNYAESLEWRDIVSVSAQQAP